jgi:hypothetical protein
MDVTSSLRSLLPYGRRSIGINQLIDKLEGYLPPEDVEPTTSPSRPMKASVAARASPTSPTLSRSPTCSPTCGSMPRR